MTDINTLPIKRRIFLLSIISLSLISFDQITKFIAQYYLASGKSYSFFSGVISFGYIENPYGFLGVLMTVPENLRSFLLIFLVALLLALTIYYILFNAAVDTSRLFFASLIVSGGLSNLLDRLIQEIGVIDFISFNLFFFITGLCNLADLYIFFGSFCLGFLLTKDL